MVVGHGGGILDHVDGCRRQDFSAASCIHLCVRGGGGGGGGLGMHECEKQLLLGTFDLSFEIPNHTYM